MIRRLALMACCFAAAGCTGSGDDDDGANPITVDENLGPDAVAELGATFTVMSTTTDGLATPRDLAFHPTRDELWTVNRETDATVTFYQPGDAGQTSENYSDPGGFHFMEEVSSISFGKPGTFGTCHESRNTYNDQQPANDYMGPVLWPDDHAIYTTPTGPEYSSHLDMLHESPYCMGIAWDHDNVYWVFDGMNGHVVLYDFAIDHGPGNNDHSDGIVRRFLDVELTRLPDVIGDMAFDHVNGILYIADTGAGRIVWVDTTTAEKDEDLEDPMEFLAEYSSWTAKHGVLAEGLDEPSGLHLDGNRLFVSEHGRAAITVLDLEGKEALGRLQTNAQSIMGLALGPDGKIWYVDASANQLVRVDP